jgi:hypothetical protein
LLILLPIFYFIYSASSQETNSQVSGKVSTESNEILTGATITAVHEPTKNVFISQTLSDGYFHFFGLTPGGPYTITVNYAGYEPGTKGNLYFNLDRSYLFND